MERQQVITVLESLANGVDPSSGANVHHSPDTVRALVAATTLLKTAPARVNPKFASAGSAWSAEEDQRLTQEFDSGMTVAQMALGHGRTSGAITARLVKLGRIDPATVKSRDRGARVVAS